MKLGSRPTSEQGRSILAPMRGAVIVGLLGLVAGGCQPNADGFDQATTLGGTSSSASTVDTTSSSATTDTLDTTAGPVDPTEGPGSTDSSATTSTSVDPTEGSSGDPGDPGLVSDALLARWYLDEASAGQAPKELLDTVEPGLDPLITYAGLEMQYTDFDGNRGLSWSTTGDHGRASASLMGTSIASALMGAQRVTVEVVVAVEKLDSQGSRFFDVGPGSNSSFAVASPRANELEVRWGENTVRTFDTALTRERQVIHVVVDTTMELAEDRIRAYHDGTKLEPKDAVGDVPAQGEGVPLTVDDELTLGNRSGGRRSFEGYLGYAALYGDALEVADIVHHVEILAADDDEP